jgi:hypothetical protein
MTGSVERHQRALAAAAQQGGVVSHRQLVAFLGWPPSAIRTQLDAARWQRVFDGVYAVTTGELSVQTRWWAAHLRCGEASVLCDSSALQAWGLRRPELPIEIAVPLTASVRTPGLVVHRYGPPLAVRSPRGSPPTVGLPHAILSVSNRLDPPEVMDLVSTACQQGRVTVEQIARAMRGKRVRHRRLIEELLAEIHGGSTTPLEIAGVRRILKAHGLPIGRGQVRERTPSSVLFRDRVVEGVIIEFDGRLGHADARSRFRDLDRDNAATLTGRPTLRFGWADVHAKQCRAADQVALALSNLGRQVSMTRCGERCVSTFAS